jgi:UDP-2-acetamido-3-amino-2,3-dideoxy-glucuronate N-acetyltransferase
MTAKNIAVVGCGYWGKNLVRNFSELGALHTICDADAATLKNIAAQYPGVVTETDYSRVLQNDEIKGVVIASPAVYHAAMVKQALLAGKDVFVEKPIALNLADGEEIVALAEKQSRVLLVGHLLLYHPAIAKLKELTAQGDFGKIQYIYSKRLNFGKFRTEENILWSFAPHDISAILLFMNGEKPNKVSAHGGYYLHQDIADVTVTTMEFNNGVRSHIFVSWLHPYKEQKLVIVGSDKMAVFDDTQPKDKLMLYAHKIEWVDDKPVPQPKEVKVIPVPADEPLKLECQDFLNCIASRGKPISGGSGGLKVLDVLSHCQQSLENNGKVVSMNSQNEGVFIHETSIVETPSHIGPGTKIWHFSHLMPDVTLGRDCVVGQNVYIARGVKIGNNVKLENNVSVFEGVTLEDDVFCGPSCVFTNVFNPRSHVSRKHEYRLTLVKKGASIGANATIVCGNNIGRYAFVGAGSVVTKDVPDYALVYGNPAKIQGWFCDCGVKLDFKAGKAECSACHRAYTLKGQECIPVKKEGDK